MYLWNNNKERRTRYGCTPKAKQPPYLTQVIQALRKESLRRLGLRRSSDLRAVIARGNRLYADRGPADDMVRFLFNVAILIEDPVEDAIYFNSARADAVFECCELVREPSPVDPNALLETFRARRQEPQAPTEAQEEEASEEALQEPDPELDAADTLEFAGVSEEMLDIMTTPETVPVQEVIPLIAADPPTEDLIPAPLTEPAPPMEASVAPVRHVMYLTPIEMEIWGTIVALAKPYNGVWRVAAPSGPEQLFERWCPNHLDCEEEEYAFVFRRFVDNNVLNEVGDTIAAQKTYVLRFDPSACRTMQIEKRDERLVSNEDLNIIRDIQRDAPPAGVRPEFAATLGIVETDEASGEKLLTVKGFERDDFVTPAMREAAKPPPPPRPARATAPPRSRPASSGPLKDIREESEHKLSAQREELQRRIDRAHIEIAGWTEQIAAIDADLARRRDTKRQDLIRKKAEIERQLAELDA